MDAAVSGARTDRNDRQGFRRKAVDPFGSSDGLAGHRIGAHGRPIAFAAQVFIRNGAFDHQYERINQTLLRLVEILHEVVSNLIRQNRVVQVNIWEPWDRTHHHIFYARLGCCSYGHRVAVASESRRNPNDVNVFDRRWSLRNTTIRGSFCRHTLFSFLLVAIVGNGPTALLSGGSESISIPLIQGAAGLSSGDWV